MGTSQPIVTPPPRTPGVGRGWTILAEAVARQLDVSTLAGVWVFAPIRRSEREWGTAVLALRRDRGRLEIHTAQYLIITRGKRRGQNRVDVSIVAESPADVVQEVLHNVQERTGEPDPPVEIEPTQWFDSPSDGDDEPPAED